MYLTILDRLAAFSKGQVNGQLTELCAASNRRVFLVHMARISQSCEEHLKIKREAERKRYALAKTKAKEDTNLLQEIKEMSQQKYKKEDLRNRAVVDKEKNKVRSKKDRELKKKMKDDTIKKLNQKVEKLEKRHNRMKKIEQMKCQKVLQELTPPKSSDILQQICCDIHNENCLLRKCENCKSNEIHFSDSKENDIGVYLKWQTSKETQTDKKWESKAVQKMNKDVIKINLLKMGDWLQNFVNGYDDHVGRVIHQYEALKYQRERTCNLMRL
ncbi:hypothetical protein PR048_015504 [Dryococelus australis]|uniref:Recombination activating protein 1 n=1 Tax=Dryococelus australis TaxID=614101 RepID=A0ABQ9HH43_9NEOP|nr:hypothetical protein PR048_015504 [Dryococelus australis]